MEHRLNCLSLAIVAVALSSSGEVGSDGTATKGDAQGGTRSVRAIRPAGEAIRPLHTPKRPARPGEWLDKHPERTQTLAQYLASQPNTPTERLTTLYLQPVGDFNTEQQKLLDATAELLGIFYGVPVKTLEPIGLATIPENARRKHPTWGNPQILTGHVMGLLKKKRPADAVAVLALTTADLWPGDGWNFVFGQASLRERVGVWSLYRFGDPRKDYQLALRRTLKTATHETGHMLGIFHCTQYECGMNGSNHLPEADSQPLWFCAEDEMKVWWACPVEPSTRYARLARFADDHGLDQEARFYRNSEQALKSRENRGGGS